MNFSKNVVLSMICGFPVQVRSLETFVIEQQKRSVFNGLRDFVQDIIFILYIIYILCGSYMTYMTQMNYT